MSFDSSATSHCLKFPDARSSNSNHQHPTVTEANYDQLTRDNSNLREHNARLEKQCHLLNQSFTQLNLTGRILTSENVQLRDQIVNLTSTNSQLDQHHRGRLTLYSRELEAHKSNLSEAVTRLTDCHARLEEERRNPHTAKSEKHKELLPVPNTRKTRIFEN